LGGLFSYEELAELAYALAAFRRIKGRENSEALVAHLVGGEASYNDEIEPSSWHYCACRIFQKESEL
jgi:hypothetical protein